VFPCSAWNGKFVNIMRDPKKGTNEAALNEVLNEAEDLTNNHVLHANSVRLNLSDDEVLLDLFQIEPEPNNSRKLPRGKKVGSFALPVSMAKEIGQLLLDSETLKSAIPLAAASKPETGANKQSSTDGAAWDAFEKLYGAWSGSDDADDHWLDRLRDEWDDRLDNLYEPE
jgi:hypothetical protein